MYINTPSVDDANKFFTAFNARHPEIYAALSRGIQYFEGGHIGAFRPATMDNDTYAIFNRYLKRWLSDNGFTDPEIDLVYVSINDGANSGVRAIDTASVIKIEQADNGLSRLTFKEDTGNILAIYIKEDAEELKRSVYIF